MRTVVVTDRVRVNGVLEDGTTDWYVTDQSGTV